MWCFCVYLKADIPLVDRVCVFWNIYAMRYDKEKVIKAMRRYMLSRVYVKTSRSDLCREFGMHYKTLEAWGFNLARERWEARFIVAERFALKGKRLGWIVRKLKVPYMKFWRNYKASRGYTLRQYVVRNKNST